MIFLRLLIASQKYYRKNIDDGVIYAVFHGGVCLMTGYAPHSRLVIASRFHPEPVLMSLVHLLAPSRTIVVYYHILEVCVSVGQAVGLSVGSIKCKYDISICGFGMPLQPFQYNYC